MKLYMMVEIKGELSEKEQEKLCWDMLQVTDAHSMTTRNTLEELKKELDGNCTTSESVEKDDDWNDDSIKTFEFLKGARFSSNEEKIDDNCVTDITGEGE